jgi:hypothetical protein
MVLTAVAGSTTPANRARNGPGKPTISSADPKNTVPETKVPTTVNTPTLTMEVRNFPKAKNKPKKIKAVIGLSMILGSCPPGNVVVKAEIPPVTRANNITLLISGKRIMPKNIIVNIMSGFIPNKMGGATACSTAPIPTNNAKATRFFVFISHLSSASLKLLVSPAVRSVPAAKNLILL